MNVNEGGGDESEILFIAPFGSISWGLNVIGEPRNRKGKEWRRSACTSAREILMVEEQLSDACPQATEAEVWGFFFWLTNE